MSLGKCENCVYWLRSRTVEYQGLCMRRAPVILNAPEREAQEPVWPRTGEGCGCGDFEQKTEIRKVQDQSLYLAVRDAQNHMARILYGPGVDYDMCQETAMDEVDTAICQFIDNGEFQQAPYKKP